CSCRARRSAEVVAALRKGGVTMREQTLYPTSLVPLQPEVTRYGGRCPGVRHASGRGGGILTEARKVTARSRARPWNQGRHARRIAGVLVPQDAAQRALLEPRLQHHTDGEAAAQA